jgi:integrase
VPKINNRKCSIRTRQHGPRKSFQVDCGLINDKRHRKQFRTQREALAYAKVIETKILNEGASALSLSEDVRVDASRAQQILKQYDATLYDAAKYYSEHFLRFEDAPVITRIVDKCVESARNNNRRSRSIGDLKNRLNVFAESFGHLRPCEIEHEDIVEWIHDHDEWKSQTKINYLGKVIQLFNFALKNGWCNKNPAGSIDKPSIDEVEVEAFTVGEARSLLRFSSDFDLTAYIALGLFAGLRSAEIFRMDWGGVDFEEESIVVSSGTAKKRSRRIIPMREALKQWLELGAKDSGPVVAPSCFRKRMKALREKSGTTKWKFNGLRHSFGSYHLQQFGDDTQTSKEMGHVGTDMIHKHYKALVSTKDADTFWKLIPQRP